MIFTKKMCRKFPLLFANRDDFHLECGEGWHDLIWELCEKLEPILKQELAENPASDCAHCGHSYDVHACKSPNRKQGRCLAILNVEPPSTNYIACCCDQWQPNLPYVTQIKEKFGGLRFYTSNSSSAKFYAHIAAAEQQSFVTCENCAQPGDSIMRRGWLVTLCDECANQVT
jgi:hypothetical protein